MDSRKPLDALAVGSMLLLCLTWSLQQIVLKALAQEVSPMLHIALRSGAAAALIVAWLRWRRQPVWLPHGAWQPGVLAGGLFALEFVLVGEGLRHTSAGHMVVFLYTAPVFAALGLAWKLPSERLAPAQWLGVGLAFAGIAIAFFGRDAAAPWSGAMLWGDALGLLAAAAWGATTVVVRSTPLSRQPAAQTLLYQLASAFAVLLPLALVTGQSTFVPGARVWAALAFQSVVVAFASFLAWFWLLKHYLASRLGVLSFLTPLLGVVLGAALLGEPIEPSFITGAALVLAGLLLVGGWGWWQARRG